MNMTTRKELAGRAEVMFLGLIMMHGLTMDDPAGIEDLIEWSEGSSDDDEIVALIKTEVEDLGGKYPIEVQFLFPVGPERPGAIQRRVVTIDGSIQNYCGEGKLKLSHRAVIIRAVTPPLPPDLDRIVNGPKVATS